MFHTKHSNQSTNKNKSVAADLWESLTHSVAATRCSIKTQTHYILRTYIYIYIYIYIYVGWKSRRGAAARSPRRDWTGNPFYRACVPRYCLSPLRQHGFWASETSTWTRLTSSNAVNYNIHHMPMTGRLQVCLHHGRLRPKCMYSNAVLHVARYNQDARQLS